MDRALIFLLLCAVASSVTAIPGLDTVCNDPDPSPLHIDLFLELLSNHTNIASNLKRAPVFADMDPDAPAYDIRGEGFHLASNSLSADVKRALCSNNELTIYASMFLKEAHSSGTLLELSSGQGSRLPVFGVAINAAADEIMFTYRHRGQPRTRAINVRLHPGRWRNYAFVLSGHLLQFYFDCNLVFSDIVALPDFCVDDNSFVLTFADDSDRAEIEHNDGIFAYFQHVGLYFGRGGLQNQCPGAGQECPTCGQFLLLVQRAHELQEEVEQLRGHIRELEQHGQDFIHLLQFRNCTDGDRVIPHGGFTISDQGVCYCLDGSLNCTNGMTCELTLPTPPSPLNVPTPGPLPDADCPPCMSNQHCSERGECVCDDGFTMVDDSCLSDDELCKVSELPPGQRILPIGGQGFDFRDDPKGPKCRVFFCERIIANNPPFTFASNFECFNNYTSSVCGNTSLDRFQQRMSVCCQICTHCDFVTCGEHSSCTMINNRETCVCDEFYEKNEMDECVDIDECASPDLNSCPVNSVCVNEEPGYSCDCVAGYEMSSLNGCDDIDECEDPGVCPPHSVCNNTVGSFECICLSGYEKTEDGLCAPVCVRPCQNGGLCTAPDTCTCHPGYTGDICQDDIDECDLGTHSCTHPKSECVNTMGGHFCRCTIGYRLNGSDCIDVNECESEIHQCVQPGARCLNTLGSYICLCNGVDCTGSCRRRQQFFRHDTWALDSNNPCLNCTCSHGELFCRKRACDCRDPSESRSCCPQCFPSRDCFFNNSIPIRPNAMFIDPSNPCIRWRCSSRLVLTMENIEPDCPRLNCPSDFQEHQPGRCCPICLLPPCDLGNIGQTLPMMNGCKTCICLPSFPFGSAAWQCREVVSCGQTVNCSPEDILFYDKNCCPICERDVLGTTCQTLTSLFK